MQPFTPAFKGGAPSTPVMTVSAASVHVVPAADESGGGLNSLASTKQEVAEDSQSRDMSVGVIDITSDTESSASESDSNACSSDGEDAFISKSLPQPPGDPKAERHALQVRNVKSKIVHECCELFPRSSESSIDFESDVKGLYTSCGRLIDDRFNLLSVVTDWTSRCRVCYKGRRDPGQEP